MIYNILDYGAVGDGKSDATDAIRKAIDQCHLLGGRVYIPAGEFLSGTIFLKSNIELYLEQGAVLRADIEREEMEYFLVAYHEKNIVISGRGKIDGQGRKRFVDDNADNGAHECPLNVNGKRARTTYFEDVEGLTIQGVTFYDAAFWTVHMAGCREVLIEGIKILNNDRGPNNDGIDPDCCKDVIIRGCIVETGDDAIVIKTTKKMAKLYGACENIIIQNCILHSRDSALKIGTETFADIKNIIFSDCIVKDCSRGVGIWSRDGGSISKIYVHHIMGNTRQYADCPQREFAPRWWGKGEPIFISATRRKDGERVPGKIKELFFDHINLTAESAIFIAGESESVIKSIELNEVDICWKRQSKHDPKVFDEQPSKRDVYEHEIPCVYGRYANNIKVQGKLKVDKSLSEIIKKKVILDFCEDFKIIEE